MLTLGTHPQRPPPAGARALRLTQSHSRPPSCTWLPAQALGAPEREGHAEQTQVFAYTTLHPGASRSRGGTRAYRPLRGRPCLTPGRWHTEALHKH